MQLSTAVVFGLGFATLLTLVVTPSLLALGAQVSEWRGRRRAAPGAQAEAELPLSTPPLPAK